MIYPALALVLASLSTAVNWADGNYPIGTFNTFHIWLAVQTPYLLALTRYLDGAAEKALRNFRPALKVSEEEYNELLYRLTTAPARPALLGSLAGIAVNVVMIPYYPQFIRLFGFSTEPASLLSLFGLQVLQFGVAGALVYHTIHQLRLVSHIYEVKANVNLFDLSPLYAFPGLTSKTAVGVLIYNSVWTVTMPAELTSTSMSLAIGGFFLVVNIVTFMWPLLGIHGRLVQEKERLLRENSQIMEATIADLHGRVKAGELHSVDELHVTMASLEIEKGMLTGIPTWPWRPGTLRGIVTALLLPLVVFFLQYVLQRFLAQ
jgi:hypothetical protein